MCVYVRVREEVPVHPVGSELYNPALTDTNISRSLTYKDLV